MDRGKAQRRWLCVHFWSLKPEAKWNWQPCIITCSCCCGCFGSAGEQPCWELIQPPKAPLNSKPASGSMPRQFRRNREVINSRQMGLELCCDVQNMKTMMSLRSPSHRVSADAHGNPTCNHVQNVLTVCDLLCHHVCRIQTQGFPLSFILPLIPRGLKHN